MSQWGSVPRAPENMCFPLTSARVIVLIAIVFAAVAIVFAVVVLTRHGHPVPAALGAVAATAMLSEEVARRLPCWQRPDTA
jgi:hypothetical protein